MVSTGERLKQIELHTSICSSPYDISALTILEEKRYYVALDIALTYFENLIKVIEIYIL